MKKTITTTPTHTTVAIEFENDDDFKAFEGYAKRLWREGQREQKRQQQQTARLNNARKDTA